jgi:hypothetical protein
VGVWSRGSLRKLHETQVYGPIDQLVVEGDRARALSALGESVELDLTILVGDYCTILREIWAKTPVVWTETGPFLRDPPAAHACLSR